MVCAIIGGVDPACRRGVDPDAAKGPATCRDYLPHLFFKLVDEA
jgi:hypothetical protein